MLYFQITFYFDVTVDIKGRVLTVKILTPKYIENKVEKRKERNRKKGKKLKIQIKPNN